MESQAKEKGEKMKSDSGQTAMLFIFVGGLLLFGVFYILFGSFTGSLLTVINQMISSGSIPFSQAHKDATDNLFRIWWLLPVLVIVLYLIYLVKKGQEHKMEELYG